VDGKEQYNQAMQFGWYQSKVHFCLLQKLAAEQ
jgi:hypothetical protein